jgi:UDP-glucose:(heptosyl)LPS alpha-1,3-glucosyltransferase
MHTTTPTNAPAEIASRNETLRIAVVTPELHGTGGTERVTSEIVARLARQHRVCLFAHRWALQSDVNVCFHRVPVLGGIGLIRYLSFFCSASLAVWRASRRHGPYAAVYSPGPNCAQASVVTAHFCQARYLELLNSGQHRPAPESWLDGARHANRRFYASVVARVEKIFYADPRRCVITPSRALADDLHRHYGVPPDRIRVAHSGVDAATFSPERRSALRGAARKEFGLGDGDFAFLFLGNSWQIKGLLYALRALAETPGARLLVVGTDVEPPQPWQRAAKEFGVAGRVTFVPRRADVICFYAAADALLAPSIYDSFALMPLEAAACGVPSIITRTMGVAEVLTGDDAVVLERADDVAALAAAMRRLMQDSAFREALAHNAMVRARENPWDRAYQITCVALLDAVEQHNGAYAAQRPASVEK